jgi:hypothetical protein
VAKVLMKGGMNTSLLKKKKKTEEETIVLLETWTAQRRILGDRGM